MTDEIGAPMLDDLCCFESPRQDSNRAFNRRGPPRQALRYFHASTRVECKDIYDAELS